jgi:hypothetical protein
MLIRTASVILKRPIKYLIDRDEITDYLLNFDHKNNYQIYIIRDIKHKTTHE